MTGCLTENAVLHFVRGGAPADEAARVQGHIAGCSACLSLVVQIASGASPFAKGGADPFAPPPLFDEYRLVRPLGGGAMGQVYLAHDTVLDRPVAVKFIAAVRPDGPSRERFLVEARAIARLQHPNVVSIYRVGALPGEGQPYLVSEYVRGESLDHQRGPLPWPEVLRIGLGLSRGLAAAHRRGVLHRDIKPANVIRAEDGEVKLLDFGLAKLLDQAGPAEAPSKDGAPREQDRGADASPALTREGALLGTPLYMAPELWRGEPASRGSDVYSLGALLYELCAGRPPHQGKSLAELGCAVLSADLLALEEAAPGTDPRLAEVISRCLLRDASARFPSGEELALALEAIARGASAAVTPAGNPYRGLRAFGPEHRGVFFGREREIGAVLDRLRTDGLVVVAGDSGVGKSSLCRAGVLPLVSEGALEEGLGPRVKERRWSMVHLVPGRHPARALGDALSPLLGTEELPKSCDPRALLRALRKRLGEDQGVVIFIDQLEELITQGEAGEVEVVAQVLGQLAGGLPGLRALCTLRADFLARVAALPGLGPEVARALYLLRPLSPEGLREAILGPAQAAGLRFEPPALVEELATAAQQAEGGLPLLQFALGELWEVRDRRAQVITAAALHGIGGVGGALARHADGVLGRLPDGQRAAARRILLRLVAPDGTRLRRGREELGKTTMEDSAALEALVKGRLLLAREDQGGGAFEIAHEALVQGWQTLRGWLAASAGGRAARERLERAAAEWERLGRRQELLFGPAQVAEVQALGAEVEAGPVAEAFLQASRRQVRRRRRTRLLLLTALPALVGTAGLVGYKSLRDQHAAQDMTQAERGAKATSLAQQPGQELAALVAGIQAVAPALAADREPPRTAAEGLRAALKAADHSYPLRGHGGPLVAGGFSADGERLVAISQGGVARVWEVGTGRPLVTVPGNDRGMYWAAVSPAADRFVTLGMRGELGEARLWDARSGAQVATLAGHVRWIHRVAFSFDGSRLATASDDHTARIWDAHGGRPVAVLRGHRSLVEAVAFSPDGTTVATGSGDQTVRLWDARSGAARRVLGGHHGLVNLVVFSPDSARLLTASIDGVVQLWRTEGGGPLTSLTNEAALLSAAFSPDGSRLALPDHEGFTTLLDGRTGQRLLRLGGHADTTSDASFSADGRRLVTASRDRTARIWDVASGQQVETLVGHGGALSMARFSPDGGRVATFGTDGTVRLFRTGEQLDLQRGHRNAIYFAEFSPDGVHIVTASNDRTARVWDGRSGVLLSTLRGHEDLVCFARFSPDGRRVLSGSHDHTARLWDWRTGRLLGTLADHREEVLWGAFSPDGARVATTSKDGGVRLWRAEGGLLLASREGHPGGAVMGAFSPDGLLLATAGRDGTARLWDGRTLGPRWVLQHREVADVAFSPDGARLLAAGGELGQIVDGATGRRVILLQGHSGGILSAAFSPDGALLATTSSDGTGAIHDGRTGLLVSRLVGHGDRVYGASFSHDGRRLVTHSKDATARLWEVPGGRPLATLKGHQDIVRTAAFSPDSSRVLTVSHDATGQLWDARTGQALIVPAAAQPDARDPDRRTLHQALREACALLAHQPELAEVRAECR